MADAVVDFDFSIEEFVQTTLQTVSDADGARDDFLDELWNRGDASQIVLAVIGIFPTSSAGSYNLLGRAITTAEPGQPIPAGGMRIYAFSAAALRNFRIQAASGGTITLTGTAYR